MTQGADLARRYYRLGLAAAKRREVGLALRYAERACVLDSLCRNDAHLYPDAPHGSDARHLAEICRYELGEEQAALDHTEMARVSALAGEKKWQAAAKAAQSIPHQSVRLLNIQGCLWVLANRYAPAADCFTKALAKDRGNRLAADTLVEIGRRRKYFWRFFWTS
jgi:tetratricopeptide (TPR) repeat protein